MVFLTRLVRHLWKDHTNPFTGYKQQSPDKFWIRRRVKMLSQHYFGRSRNCYKIAAQYAVRSLTFATLSRKAKKKDFRELCDARTYFFRLQFKVISDFLRQKIYSFCYNNACYTSSEHKLGIYFQGLVLDQ